VQALFSAGDLVIPSRKAEMHPRIEWQRYKIDRNSVHVLTRLTRSGRCKPMHTIGAPAIVTPMAGFCDSVVGLQAPNLATSGAKSPIVSGGYLKYSRFWETPTGDRV
jgi:hypothetical protein